MTVIDYNLKKSKQISTKLKLVKSNNNYKIISVKITIDNNDDIH